MSMLKIEIELTFKAKSATSTILHITKRCKENGEIIMI